MTSWVQKLAETVCPACQGLCPSCTPELALDEDGNCATCHGTGALAPGLRRECLCISMPMIGPGPTWARCEECFNEHGKVKGQHSNNCRVCQGSGWTLIPEAEQMGVLVALPSTTKFFSGGDNRIGIWQVVVEFDSTHLLSQGIGKAFDADQLEALAHAICKAQGLSEPRGPGTG